MAKTPKLPDTEQVQQHINALGPELKTSVSALREIILGTSPEIGEQIKWNNPCFYYTGPIAPYEAKEYKREIAVFNLFKGRVMLVFPSGARIPDPCGILEGRYTDGRRTATFKGPEDIVSKADALRSVIRQWLSTVEKP